MTARTDHHLTHDDRTESPVGILIAIGTVVVVAAAFVAAQVPVGEPGLRLTVLAAVLVAYAAWSVDRRAVLAVVPLAWLVQDGFLLDRYGVLEWRGWSDLARLGVLLVAGLAGLLIGRIWQRETGVRRG